MTDPTPDSESSSPRPRGLWSLMGSSANPAPAPAETDPNPDESPPRDEAANRSAGPAPESLTVRTSHQDSTGDDLGREVDESEETSTENQRPKQHGLWGMMKAPRGTLQTDREPEAATPGSSEDGPSPRKAAAPTEAGSSAAMPPRSLFALMGKGPDAGPESAVPIHDSLAARTVSDSEGATADGSNSIGDDAPPMMPVIDPADLEPASYRRAAAQAKRQSWFAAAAGLGAVAASGLSFLPGFLVSLPASALGFLAIVSAYLALTGAGRRDINPRTRYASACGIVLGIAGIFLGPLYFAGLGRNLREATGHNSTGQHLQHIGQGIDQYYQDHEAYPIGGLFNRDDAGTMRGQHGWMTFLLPFIGESELYSQIDQGKPFDDPANRSAMGHNIDLYFAAGGDRARIGQGFSVTHFAGVGGEVDEGGLSHLGIFERDAAVKREEVTDGLANTLIVGELGGTYPPWGDPENWRKVGRGINRDVNGFGSANGRGAMFLLGDGSVRFFNNKTDPKLLKKMSTRDGSE